MEPVCKSQRKFLEEFQRQLLKESLINLRKNLTKNSLRIQDETSGAAQEKKCGETAKGILDGILSALPEGAPDQVPSAIHKSTHFEFNQTTQRKPMKFRFRIVNNKDTQCQRLRQIYLDDRRMQCPILN